MDPQIYVNTLLDLDDKMLSTVLLKTLQAKPELAPDLVNEMIPDLTYAPSKALTQRRCIGKICKLSPERGLGFIDCSDLKAVFGEDVVVKKEQVGNLVEGTEVSFAVTLNDDCKPQAFDLQPQGNSNIPAVFKNMQHMHQMPQMPQMPQMGMMMGKGPSGNDMDSQMAMMMGKGSCGGPDMDSMNMMMGKGPATGSQEWMSEMKGMKGTANATVSKGGTVRAQGAPFTGGQHANQEILGEFYGIIKSFNASKGFGFIACDTLREAHDGDVYLNSRFVGDFKVGHEVKFTAFLFNGRLQGKDLQDATGMVTPQSGVKPGVGQQPREDEQELGMFVGKVVSVDTAKGFGFIKCETLTMQGYQGDAFFHQKQEGDFVKGDDVAFMAVLRNGKLAGRDLQPASNVLGNSGGGSIGGVVGDEPAPKKSRNDQGGDWGGDWGNGWGNDSWW
eukprot:TRINITY_DN3910_c0_g1_i1.p1 TRINITY_DN3910_c0_g1~~TRINITY_DN3910_c0_g1_i1.p1  ORF type:complete len:445 (-),score=94.75 TRINITY_DN3910_c0_g1_i1:351-1685(-)